MHFGLFIHFIGQIRLIGHEAVYKSDKLVAVKHEPEMLSVMSQALFKFFFGGRLGRREALGLHGGYSLQIFDSRCSDCHMFLLLSVNKFVLFYTKFSDLPSGFIPEIRTVRPHSS